MLSKRISWSRRQANPRVVLLALSVLVGIGTRSAFAELPRLVMADLHGTAESADTAVGISIMLSSAVTRTGRMDVVPRPELLKAFIDAKFRERTGLWLGVNEAPIVCKAVNCTQLVVGTYKQSPTEIVVQLRLLQHDGSLVRKTKVTHPVRMIQVLPQVLGKALFELLQIPGAPPPGARPAALSGLGGAWNAVQKGDGDLAVFRLEQVFRPQAVTTVQPNSGAPGAAGTKTAAQANAFDPRTTLAYADPDAKLADLLGERDARTKLRADLILRPKTTMKALAIFAEKNPQDIGVHFLHARALIDVGQAKDALLLLSNDDSGVAEVHLLRARALMALKQGVKAEKELSAALELDPANVDAHMLLGETLHDRGDNKASEHFLYGARKYKEAGDVRFGDALMRAVKVDPKLSVLLAEADGIHLSPEEAAEIEARVAKEGKGDSASDAIAGTLAAARGDLDAALARLTEARKKSPKDPLVLRALGKVALEKGDPKLAAECLRQAYAIDPSPRLALETARAERACGKLEDARVLYEKAIRSPREASAAQRELADILLAQGKTSAAVELLRRAVQDDPHDADLQLKFADALTKIGKKDEAKSARVQAMSLDPDAETIEDPALASAVTHGDGRSENMEVAPNEAHKVVEQLDQVLERFNALEQRKDDAESLPVPVLMVYMDSPTLTDRLLGRGTIRTEVLTGALAEVLSNTYKFTQVVPVDRNEAATATALANQLQLSQPAGLFIEARPLGQTRIGLHISLVERFTGKNPKAFSTDADITAPEATIPGTRIPLFVLVTGTLAGVLYLFLRPKRELIVQVVYDNNNVDGLFSLRLSRHRLNRLGIVGNGEQAFVDAVRKKGSNISRRSASMVGRETKFHDLPTGNWWIYLFGVFLEEDRPVGNFLSEKRVELHKTGNNIVSFNLIPEETSVTVRVFDASGLVIGAPVWTKLEENALYTTKSAGGAMLRLAKGDHEVSTRVGGHVFKKTIQVASTAPITVAFATHEIGRAEGLLGAEQGAPRPVGPENTPMPAIQPPHAPPPIDFGRMSGVAPIDLFGAQKAAESARYGGAGKPRYERQKELGRGAMGVVYQARDIVLERQVALKIIGQDLKSRPDIVELFMREARSLAALNHPNIVTVFDFGEQEGDYFMALELVNGKTLEERLLDANTKLSLADAIDVAAEVCEGLAYAHEQRVIHRDVKPANIFVLQGGRVKIMDFGLARVVKELQIKSTMIAGTPLYMSPEQIRGTDLDFRADLYSLGCMLYEMVSGQPPFYEGEVLYHHMHTKPKSLMELRKDVPAGLDEAILRCLEKDKDARFGSVREFGQLLRQIRRASF